MRAAARELDYDRYLAALLAPAHARYGLMALAAFHGEVARIPLTVREPGVGDIRLQWWRDALATPAGTATGNPVADAMREVARAHALPVDKLVGMIDAYGLELEAGALTTGSAVDAHAAATPGRNASARRADCRLRRPLDASAAARGRTSGGARAVSARAAGSRDQGPQSVR